MRQLCRPLLLIACLAATRSSAQDQVETPPQEASETGSESGSTVAPTPETEPSAPTASAAATTKETDDGLSVRERAIRKSKRLNVGPVPWDLIGAGAVALGGTVGSALLYSSAWDEHVRLRQGAAWGRAEAEETVARGQLKLAGSIACGAVAVGAVAFGAWRFLSREPGPPLAFVPAVGGGSIVVLGRFD